MLCNVCTLEKTRYSRNTSYNMFCSHVFYWVGISVLVPHFKIIRSFRKQSTSLVPFNIAREHLMCAHLCDLSTSVTLLYCQRALLQCHVFLCDRPYAHTSLLSHFEFWLISHLESCKRVGTHRWLKHYCDDESIFKGSCTLSISRIITTLPE